MSLVDIAVVVEFVEIKVLNRQVLGGSRMLNARIASSIAEYQCRLLRHSYRIAFVDLELRSPSFAPDPAQGHPQQQQQINVIAESNHDPACSKRRNVEVIFLNIVCKVAPVQTRNPMCQDTLGQDDR